MAGRPFDNINDYVNAPRVFVAAFDNAGGVLADANGNALGVSGYTARLMITPSALNGIGDDGNAADTNVLRITVQVSYGNETVTLDGYRTRYAPNHL
jgi:MSHA pilin protein MshD